jgi:hypothetical protein
LKGKLNDLFNKENNKFIITKQYKFWKKWNWF